TGTKKFCQQKVEIPGTGTKRFLPGSSAKRWKFPGTGRKNLFPSPLPAKWWNIAQKRNREGERKP
ncbi:MAG: hypothetical protein V2G48_07715, partial [bacterium JZ-2024 1]